MRLVWRENCNYKLQNHVWILLQLSSIWMRICVGCERRFQKNGRLCQRFGSVMQINSFNQGARCISEKPRSIDAGASQRRLRKSESSALDDCDR
jgi:predicted amidophosphoribosyltransferase